MAPKKPNPVEDLPAASSTDDEVSSSEGEEDSSTEDDETQLSKPSTDKPDSDFDSDSENDSEPEKEQPNSSTVKAVSTKINEDTPKKTRSTAIVSTPPPKSMAVKRGSQTGQGPNKSKRAKKSDSDGVGEKSEDPKKQLFQRLFSEDDEVMLLQGLIEFDSVNGVNPSKDMSAFYDFIKKSMHFDVSVSQLKDKIRKLKMKFMNNLKRGKISNPHEQKVFDLSKQIWGSEVGASGGESSVKLKGKVNNGRDNSKKLAALKADLGMDDNKEKEAEKIVGTKIDWERNFGSKLAYDFKTVEEVVLSRGLDMVDGEKRVEMEDNWRKLRIAELELFIQRNELISEQAKLLLDSYKKINN